MNSLHLLKQFFVDDLCFQVTDSVNNCSEIYDYDQLIGTINEFGLSLDYNVLLKNKYLYEKVISMFGSPDYGTDSIAVWEWCSINDGYLY